MRALPLKVYELAEWELARLGVKCRVGGNGHFYPLPRQHARHQVNVRLTGAAVE